MDVLSQYLSDIRDLEEVLQGLMAKGFLETVGADDLGQTLFRLSEKGERFIRAEGTGCKGS